MNKKQPQQPKDVNLQLKRDKEKQQQQQSTTSTVFIIRKMRFVTIFVWILHRWAINVLWLIDRSPIFNWPTSAEAKKLQVKDKKEEEEEEEEEKRRPSLGLFRLIIFSIYYYFLIFVSHLIFDVFQSCRLSFPVSSFLVHDSVCVWLSFLTSCSLVPGPYSFRNDYKMNQVRAQWFWLGKSFLVSSKQTKKNN